MDAERYLGRAEQLERLAGELKDPVMRLQLQDVAADWRRLAEKAAAEEARTWRPKRVQGNA